MENNNLDYKIEWGILIHQLPKEFMGKAIKVLPRDIKHMLIDESGMRVYFCRKEICDEFIRKKCLVLDGILFNIFSTVTCLTIFGIAPVASKETIKTKLQNKGMRVLDLYQITERNHYRIVLDVPEVLANIELNPIFLEASYGSGFHVEFYCRVCRTEGHKQYQCQQISTENPGEDDKRKKCAEAYSNSKRNSKQGSFVKPSSSGVRNTIVQSQEIQSSSNSSTRENVVSTEATPSRPTVAESPTRRISKLTTRKKEDVRGRTRHLRSAKKSRMLNSKYPCSVIIKIIMDTQGILPPARLLEFIKEVYHKKNSIEYAEKYTRDIPAVVQQIRCVIDQYDLSNLTTSTANKDIRIMDDLCNRLDSQLK